MKLVKPTIGIVGYGAFTKLIIRYLHQDFNILVYSRDPGKSKRDGKFKFGSAKQVLNLDTVILSIPAQHYNAFLTKHLKLINPSSLWIDVASVKVKPLAAMDKLLPKTVQILGTHPMFGPYSARDSLEDLKMVLCPIRIDPEKLEGIKTFLESKKLKLFTCTPEEHDQAMAYVQGLSHYIARLMQHMKIPETELSTLAYDQLLLMRDVQGNDSWDLFYSIAHENPYTREVYEYLQQAIKDLNKKIDYK